MPFSDFRLGWRHTILRDLCSCRARLRQQLYWWWISGCDVNSHMRWLPELTLIRVLFVLWSQAWQSHSCHFSIAYSQNPSDSRSKVQGILTKKKHGWPWRETCFSHFAFPFLFSSETFSRYFTFLISTVLCWALFLIDTVAKNSNSQAYFADLFCFC